MTYGLFHYSMVVGMPWWGELFVGLVCLTGEETVLLGGVGAGGVGPTVCCGLGV